jgi:hypothetical protein
MRHLKIRCLIMEFVRFKIAKNSHDEHVRKLIDAVVN